MRRVGLLLRRTTSNMQLCSLNLVPRYGKPARRPTDCPHNCEDFAACEKRRIEKENHHARAD